MPHTTKQTKIGDQEIDHIVRVGTLVLDLVNAPAYALFMAYKNFKRDQNHAVKGHKETIAGKTLQAILDMLKTALALQGVDADSEKL